MAEEGHGDAESFVPVALDETIAESLLNEPSEHDAQGVHGRDHGNGQAEQREAAAGAEAFQIRHERGEGRESGDGTHAAARFGDAKVPAGQSEAAAQNNGVTRMLAFLLDLPSPGEPAVPGGY